MKIAVCVKQVPDTEATIVPDGSGIDEGRVEKWILNPYDEYAVEEAVRLAESEEEAELVAVCLGPERAKTALRTALAMGADRAIHIVSEDARDPSETAAALAVALQADGKPDVVFAGVMAIDDCAAQVHLRLAAHLGASSAVNASAFEWNGKEAEVTRDAGAGVREHLVLPAPVLVAVTKEINKPRYPTLPNVIKAKKKEVRRLTPEEAGFGRGRGAYAVAAVEPPEEVSGGTVLEGDAETAAAELVGRLREEAKVV